MLRKSIFFILSLCISTGCQKAPPDRQTRPVPEPQETKQSPPEALEEADCNELILFPDCVEEPVAEVTEPPTPVEKTVAAESESSELVLFPDCVEEPVAEVEQSPEPVEQPIVATPVPEQPVAVAEELPNSVEEPVISKPVAAAEELPAPVEEPVVPEPIAETEDLPDCVEEPVAVAEELPAPVEKPVISKPIAEIEDLPDCVEEPVLAATENLLDCVEEPKPSEPVAVVEELPPCPEEIIPECTEPLTAEEQKAQEILVPEFKELMLAGSSQAVRDCESCSWNGVLFCELDPPGSQHELAQTLSPLFIGQPIRRNSLDELKKQVLAYYRSHGRPLVSVVFPRQDITDGNVRLIVVESKVNQIKVQEPKHFALRQIEKGLHLHPGEPVDNQQLSQDIAALNRNPFRRTSALLSPGEKPWTTNIDIITEDRYPFRFYAGSDNTGNPVTEKSRLFAGINWGNALNLGHIASFQWTAALDLKKMMSYTGSYTVPFSWGSTLTAFGGFSKIEPELTGLKSEGTSGQISARYKIPLPTYNRRLTQEFTAGYDYKQTNNNLAFAATPSVAIDTKTVELSQFTASYLVKYEWPQNSVSGWIDVYVSPFRKWFENQSATAYNRLQPGALPQYGYTQLTVNDEFEFSKWSLWGQWRMQLSTNTLLPSEQFGLGGYSTVRGYQERLVNFDNALCLNFELRSPSWSFFEYFKSKRARDTLYGLVFFDLGYGFPHQTENTPVNLLLNPPDKTLIGVGPGLRYSIERYLTGRFDLGFPLIAVKTNNQTPHVHFSLICSY